MPSARTTTRGAASHQPRNSPRPVRRSARDGMERLAIVLLDVLGRHKAHGGPRHRCRDGRGSTAVVCVRLDVRLDTVRRHALHRVARRAEASRPIRRATTGFDADEHRRQLRDTGHQVLPGQALARHDVAPVIHPHRVQHALDDSDPEDVHLMLPGAPRRMQMVAARQEFTRQPIFKATLPGGRRIVSAVPHTFMIGISTHLMFFFTLGTLLAPHCYTIADGSTCGRASLRSNQLRRSWLGRTAHLQDLPDV
jgi:hypothetical protein